MLNIGYVYRYIDKNDEIIKYVGIVWSNNRTLMQRIKEHEINDEWYKGKEWRIEYIKTPITNRTDAEYFESHYVSLFGTDKWYNIKKAGWGTSDYLPIRSDWIDVESSSLLKKENKEIMKLSRIIDRQNKNIKDLENKISKLEESNLSYKNMADKYCGGVFQTITYINGFKRIIDQYEADIKLRATPVKIEKMKDKMLFILSELQKDVNDMLRDKRVFGEN